MGKPLYIELNNEQAWALTELAKRIGWEELRQLSADDSECEPMQAAVAKLGKELSEQGFEPR
ncbi:MAG: hypothetical protein R3F50_11360 [Gammaproteobacteria bacterium]